MLGFCFVVLVVIFFSVIFYVEGGFNILSILDVFWWIVIIMIGVGYGDVIFFIFLGKFVGFFCVMSGIVFFCFFILVLVLNFIKCYFNYGNFNERKKVFVENFK